MRGSQQLNCDYCTEIRPAWTDHNGHLNVAYYALIFDQATDHFLERLGLGPAYLAECGSSTFAVESHSRYFSEVHEGQAVRVESTLLAFDDKRILYGHQMYRAKDDALAAQFEQISLHVDLSERRVHPWPQGIANNFQHVCSENDAFGALTLPVSRKAG
ncbi:thioesterase family protein [Nitratireductor sp. L15S-10]|uniref:thioesterase family protein n=1 Tax=Nitratireductor sp. L15S-10 TaxID=3034028 RepID=UPI003857F378